jgi:hypothetical protein
VFDRVDVCEAVSKSNRSQSTHSCWCLSTAACAVCWGMLVQWLQRAGDVTGGRGRSHCVWNVLNSVAHGALRPLGQRTVSGPFLTHSAHGPHQGPLLEGYQICCRLACRSRMQTSHVDKNRPDHRPALKRLRLNLSVEKPRCYHMSSFVIPFFTRGVRCDALEGSAVTMYFCARSNHVQPEQGWLNTCCELRTYQTSVLQFESYACSC